MVNHDVKPGPLKYCQVCGSKDLQEVIDLGSQPLCDSLLSSPDDVANAYPLSLWQCRKCSLAQMGYIVPATEVYPATYPYRAGISWPVVEAHKAMAKSLVDRFGPGFCVDIGSNDGTLLAQFQKLGCEVLGVEPTGIAEIARKAGIPTVRDFFSEEIAYGVTANHGRASLITMTNVFAHMADLGEVMRGVCELLDDDGVLVIENHYLLDILERNQFDSIYHEHVRTYSLKSLIRLFQQYGLEVFDVDRVPRYGGNIRVYVATEGLFPVSLKVEELLKQEDAAGLYGWAWEGFRARVMQNRDAFREFVANHPVVGCSAPGRATTLLNFYGVTPDVMPWTGEIDGSLKIGKYIPGCRVPIVSNARIAKEQPEYLMLLAWHYGAEIEARLRKEGVKSKLIRPLPDFTVQP